jgi:3-(3-hydroxy-phenyl)propionate hydroxylase
LVQQRFPVGTVAVVGAGPVGMSAALILAARGINVSLFERRLTTSDEPKAISLDDEALRTFQLAGVDAGILSIIVPGTGTKYFDADGEPLFSGRAEVPGNLGFPFKNPFAQPDLERVLFQAIEQDPHITAVMGTSVTRVTDSEDGVSFTISNRDGSQRLTADYLLGADGGRSSVRSSVGINMVGRSYDDVWLVVDTTGDPHTERYGMHYGMPARPHVIVPGLNGRCRYEFRLFAGEGEAGEEPSMELIIELISRYRAISADQVQRAVMYRFNGLNAENYRAGRVFLLGDAAHMMPPFAGQGLNSGLRDAANLAWKLSAVIAGTSPKVILDSYDLERRPQAQLVIRSSEKLGRVVMTTSARLARYRDVAIRRALATPNGRSYFEHMRYRAKGAFESGLFVPGGIRAGSTIAQPRVFDMKCSQIVLLDEVLGRDWSLIGVDVSGGDWGAVEPIVARARAVAVHIPLADHMPSDPSGTRTVLDFDGRLDREFRGFANRFLLIRPDRVIAASWHPRETESVEATIGPWFSDALPRRKAAFAPNEFPLRVQGASHKETAHG